MDVRNAIRNILPFAKNPVSESKRRESIQGETKSSADRDPNGQQQKPEDTPQRNLSEEEIQAAIKELESLAGVKDNGLTIHLERKDGIPVVFVKDRIGKVVRRIPETELAQLKSRAGENKSTGRLLNKAM